jgi:hypothetical protein
MMMATSYSRLNLAIPVLLLHSYGVSIANIERLLILGSQFYSQVTSNISTLMAGKMDGISLECSRKVTGLSSGFFITLDTIQEIHFVLLEVHSLIKKSLLLNFQMAVSQLSMLELY